MEGIDGEIHFCSVNKIGGKYFMIFEGKGNSFKKTEGDFYCSRYRTMESISAGLIKQQKDAFWYAAASKYVRSLIQENAGRWKLCNGNFSKRGHEAVFVQTTEQITKNAVIWNGGIYFAI